MAMESNSGLMALSTRAVLRTDKQMATAGVFRLEARFTRVCSCTILCRDMASTSLMMAGFILANSKTEKNRVKECTSLKITAKSMRENLRRMTVTATVLCTTPMVKNSWDCGRQERNMERVNMNGRTATSTRCSTLRG
jgi:hypothetical protein